MAAPNEIEIDVEASPKVLSDPICKPVGIAFAPAQANQPLLVGLVVTAYPIEDHSCPLTVTSTNPQLLMVQHAVVVERDQTTAVVYGVVIGETAAAALTRSRRQSVVYVYATLGADAVGFARVKIPGAHAAVRIEESGDTIPSVTSIAFLPPPLERGQTSVTVRVTLSGPAPPEGVEVIVGSNHLEVFDPQNRVRVSARDFTVDVSARIIPPNAETIVYATAYIGDDVPKWTSITVPQKP